MRLHAPGTFITDPLFYIPQEEKIAPNIAAKIVRVNGPSEKDTLRERHSCPIKLQETSPSHKNLY